MKFFFEEHIPICLQIVEYVKVLIITGDVKPGEKLFAVREMASELGINPNTVQKAYGILEEEGVIKGERGSGNYITQDKNVIIAIQTELRNRITEAYIIKMKGYGFADGEIVRILKQKIGEMKHENS